MTKINTILQCFVDTNLELDESSGFSLANLPTVTFTQPSYDIEEGQVVDVDVSLSEPSINGLEEIEVGIVVNNTSVADFSTLGETYPRILNFSAGQQTQTIRFLANTDLFEEDLESFDAIIGVFTNVTPGVLITTTINIIDQTNLKEVFISEQGGAVTPGFIGPTLEFSAIEGASKTITVSLGAPSTLGVESVDVQFTNITTDSNDYTVLGATSLSWNIGEQTQTFTIQANEDIEIEDDEVIQIDLVNPGNVNIIDFSTATFNVIDASPEARFATIGFQGFYVQKGGKAVANTQARWLRRNPAVGYDAPQNDQMFIKFGEPIIKSYTSFNEPNGSSSGFESDAGPNTIVGYDPPLFPSLQHNNVVFFGAKPIVNFGPGTNTSINTSNPEYGDLKVVIKNVGTYPAKISGSTVDVNDSVTMIIDKFDYSVKLPANAVLLSGGTFYNGSPLVEDTLTQCLYDFTFEVQYSELGFQLRDIDNSVSSNGEFHLGTHLFIETYNSANADLPQNHHNLISEINNIWPYWETNFSFPNTGPFCIPAGSIANQAPQFPTQQTDLQNVQVDGIMFLHQTSTNENSMSTTKTEFSNFLFLPSGQTAASNGCSGRDIEYEVVFGPELLTASIPFLVI